MDELLEGRVAMPADYGLLQRLQGLYSPRLQFIPTTSSEESARLVSQGDADVMIDFLPSAQLAIRSQNITNLKAAANLDNLSPQLATALRSDWPALVNLLNRAAATRSMDEQTRLFERFQAPVPSSNKTGLYILIGALLLTILALAGSAAVRRRRTGRLLRESEELLRRAERVSHSGSWKLDRRTRDLLFSAESHRLFDWQSGTNRLSFQEYCELYDSASQEALRLAVESAAAGDSSR